LEPIEREAARARKAAGTNQYTEPSGNFPEGSKGEALVKVARTVGMSRHTLRKAREVVEAAEQEPELYADLVERMDKSNSVDSAYREMMRRKAEKEVLAQSEHKPGAAPAICACQKNKYVLQCVVWRAGKSKQRAQHTHRQAGVKGDMGSIFDYRLSTEQAARLAGATVRMLDYWCSRGLITPTIPAQGKGSAREFGFVDMVRIKVLVRLRNAGVPLQRIRRALEQLREWDEPDPLTSGRLIVIGDRLFWAKSDSELVDILSQQRAMVQVVLLDLAEIARETEAKLLEVCAA